MLEFLKLKIVRIALGVIIGGLLGFLYYKFIGCRTGSCPITSNFFSSIIYGGLMGLIITAI